mmetsp:Transcript_49904/g.93381  ORF Transcript_49904/g.93381 Transcript_49904/m.93381 type:complete len:184 (+) Transcript_49904:81-632(+)
MRQVAFRRWAGIGALSWTVRCQVVSFATPTADKYNLQRFVDAQAPVYEVVLRELRAGQKRNHWMWFVFPQIAGLGVSYTAKFYALSSRDEATAYLHHSLLGPRLHECVGEILQIRGKSAVEIFGQVDAMKLRSSLTLFDKVEPETEFHEALRVYFGGKRDTRTLDLLDGRSDAFLHSKLLGDL